MYWPPVPRQGAGAVDVGIFTTFANLAEAERMGEKVPHLDAQRFVHTHHAHLVAEIFHQRQQLKELFAGLVGYDADAVRARFTPG